MATNYFEIRERSIDELEQSKGLTHPQVRLVHGTLRRSLTDRKVVEVSEVAPVPVLEAPEMSTSADPFTSQTSGGSDVRRF